MTTLKPGGGIWALLALVVAIVLFSSLAMADEIIQVHAGPDAGLSVSGSFGDFYIIPIGGGYCWVGTAAEYDRGRANGYAIEHGYRPADIDGTHNNFVQSATLATSVGSHVLNGIDVEIDFGQTVDVANHYPPIPAANRYITALWFQNGGSNAEISLIDQKTHHVYRPYWTHIDLPYHVADLSIPFRALRDPMIFMFTIGAGRPGAIEARSIAWAHYAVLTQTLAGLKSDEIPASATQRLELRSLPVADPSIPRTSS